MGNFTVIAGKYDGGERNCKYVESFDTLDEAIVAYQAFDDYPWCEIVYEGADNTIWVIGNVCPQPEHLRN